MGLTGYQIKRQTYIHLLSMTVIIKLVIFRKSDSKLIKFWGSTFCLDSVASVVPLALPCPCPFAPRRLLPVLKYSFGEAPSVGVRHCRAGCDQCRVVPACLPQCPATLLPKRCHIYPYLYNMYLYPIHTSICKPHK